jgi:hypothetical protein
MSLTNINDIVTENEQLQKKKLDDKDTLFKEIFIEKVTKSDESVRKFTKFRNL